MKISAANWYKRQQTTFILNISTKDQEMHLYHDKVYVSKWPIKIKANSSDKKAYSKGLLDFWGRYEIKPKIKDSSVNQTSLDALSPGRLMTFPEVST